MKILLIIRSFASVTFLIAIFSHQAFSQLSGAKSIPGDYPTLTAAIADLNSQGVSSNVTLNVLPGNPQTAPQGGLVIGGTGSAILSGVNATGSNRLVTISGNGNIMTADSIQSTGSLTDAVFKLIGADYITIEDFIIQENPANTISAAASNNMTEWGIALLYVNTSDGSKNNTILNNTITLNRMYANTFGIYSNVQHSATNATQLIWIMSLQGSNSDLKIKGNQISNVNMGIAAIGSSDPGLMDLGLIIGGNLAHSNTITDFGYTGNISNYVTVVHDVCGILVTNQQNCNVSYNSITSSSGGTIDGKLRGIYSRLYGNLSQSTFTLMINNNSVALHSGNLTGDITGISNELGSDGLTVQINNNDIHELQYASNASGEVTAIENLEDTYCQTISSNTFSNLTINTTGNVTLIQSSGVPSVNYGQKILRNNSTAGSVSKTLGNGTFYCINEYTASLWDYNTTTTVDSNDFSNISVTGNTNFRGYSLGQNYSVTYDPTLILRSNFLHSINSGTGYITGISAPRYKVEHNTLLGFTGNGSIYGIGSSLDYVNSNTIGEFVSSTGVTAISVLNPDGGKVTGNKIYDLTSTSGIVCGIGISSNVTTDCEINIINNIIGDLNAPNSNSIDAILGISFQNHQSNGGRLEGYISHNTIWINATSSSTTTFGSSLIRTDGSIVQTPQIYSFNNILVNTSVAGPTGGFNTAVKFVTGGTQGCYEGNGNCYYIGQSSPNQLIFGSGYTNYSMTSAETLLDFATLLSNGSEHYSITEDAPFLNITGTSPQFLHIDSTVVTGIESGGYNFIGHSVDTDFDNEKRYGAPGYTGYGLAPDIGADEIWNLPLETDETNEITKCTAFPNPANDMLNISLDKFSRNEKYTLSIYNSIGQPVYISQKVKEKTQVDVRDFSAGIYLVQLQTEKGSRCVRVVVGHQ